MLQWQEATREYARQHGYVNTMLGRRRNLRPGINASRPFERSRAERAAINTPIQGSAADVATAAMLAIGRDKWLADNGWRLLLQVCVWGGGMCARAGGATAAMLAIGRDQWLADNGWRLLLHSQPQRNQNTQNTHTHNAHKTAGA